jgi:predicted phage baseplate assembly protein
MPLAPPKLDDRDFHSLVEEARARIPRYLPEWTDWNASDPGITLLELHAWLTETILYRLNQLPELNYVKFLQLLGVEQRPARPAQADLTFILKPEDKVNAPEILIEKRTMVSVSARDLEEPLYFETDRTLTAISARLTHLIYVPDITISADSEDPDKRPQSVTQDNDFEGRTFAPFGDPATPGAALLLGFSSELPFSRKEIGLQIYLAEAGQALLVAPEKMTCGPETEAEDAPQIGWQWWDGVGWSDLDVTGNETHSLTRSGQVYFKVPGQMPPTSYDSLDLPPIQEEEQPRYYWLRIWLKGGAYAKAPAIDRISTNTVRATAALTVFDEAVGSSDGSPNQMMELRYHPILSDPPLELDVDEGAGPEPWTQVSDLYGRGPDDAVYVFNRATAQITFGDGLRGRIPVAGQFNVIARQYRYGGGRSGNVGARTITDLVTPIPEVEEVFNYRPAEGGADEEPLSDTMLRAPREIKARNRAVTLEDFALLAKETPGALVARAAAHIAAPSQEELPSLLKVAARPSAGPPKRYMPANTGLAIYVVIVPQSEDAKPVPSEATKHLVCRYLDERRLITTQVLVQGPQYHDIDVVLDVRARDDADLKEVKNAIDTRLSDYFHPLRGGEDSKGWPFGRDVYHSELLREIMVLPGILRVENLKLRKLQEELTEQETQSLTEDDPSDFPDTCKPVTRYIRVVVPSQEEDSEPQIRYYKALIFHCLDLPVDEGALLALRRAEIFVSYARS